MIIKKIILKLLVICFFLQSAYSCAQQVSYKGAITAKELLVLMSACDLLSLAKNNNISSALLNEMCQKGKALLKLGMSSYGPEPWVWQPGKLSDHKDFKYAGNQKINENLQVKKVGNISMDSAHFYSKWPLFFLSARNSSQKAELLFFQNAIKGLVANLFKNVVSIDKEGCVVRYKNFIDGTNGVYRWNFERRGVTYGHSSFALSYTPFFSSLALLDNKKISDHYKKILSCYPYSKVEKKKYFWSRGLEDEKLLVLLSAKRPSEIVNTVPNETEKRYYKQYFYKRINPVNGMSSKDAYAAVVGDRMLVMHYAVYMGYAPWVKDFNRYLDKISNLICVGCDNKFKFYHELHLLYFVSKYLYLNKDVNFNDNLQVKKIFNVVLSKLNNLYLVNQNLPVSNVGWDGVVYFNFKDYVDWKLNYYK